MGLRPPPPPPRKNGALDGAQNKIIELITNNDLDGLRQLFDSYFYQSKTPPVPSPTAVKLALKNNNDQISRFLASRKTSISTEELNLITIETPKQTALYISRLRSAGYKFPRSLHKKNKAEGDRDSHKTVSTNAGQNKAEFNKEAAILINVASMVIDSFDTAINKKPKKKYPSSGYRPPEW